jgi:hypothetical protein
VDERIAGGGEREKRGVMRGSEEVTINQSW